jgi:dihydrofolate reductase
MRNVILQEFVSLDGFAAGPNDSVDFVPASTQGEYQLVVCPVVLGSGKPLFRDKVDSFGMKLLEARSFDRGAVLLAYTAANGRFAAS